MDHGWLQKIVNVIVSHCVGFSTSQNCLSFCCDWLGHGIRTEWLQMALKSSISKHQHFIWEIWGLWFFSISTVSAKPCDTIGHNRPDIIMVTKRVDERWQVMGMMSCSGVHIQQVTFAIYSRNIRLSIHALAHPGITSMWHRALSDTDLTMWSY